MSEHDEQAAYFKWVRIKRKTDPIYWNITATLNGVRLPTSQRIKAKATGMDRGIPDVLIAVPTTRFHYAWLEFKVKPNNLTPEQREWMDRQAKMGVLTAVVWSVDQAIKLTEAYLRLRLFSAP